MIDCFLGAHMGIIGTPIFSVNRHTDREYRQAYIPMTLAERLKHIRELRGLKQTPVARAVGIKQSSLSELETGASKEMAGRTLDGLSRVYKVNPAWLLHEKGPMETPKGARAPTVEIEDMEYRFAGRPNPVVGYVMGGDRGYYDELAYSTGHGDGAVLYPTQDKNTYALRVRGTSMEPRIHPGEYVVVMPNHTVKTNDEVVVRTKDGRVMVKKLGARRNGVIELKSINESGEHPIIKVDESNVERLHYVGGIAKDDLYRSTM